VNASAITLAMLEYSSLVRMLFSSVNLATAFILRTPQAFRKPFNHIYFYDPRLFSAATNNPHTTFIMMAVAYAIWRRVLALETGTRGRGGPQKAR
jgi:hypothetical protein